MVRDGASRLLTMRGESGMRGGELTRLPLPRRRPMRLLRGARSPRCPARMGLRRRLLPAASLQALLQRIHQANDVARPLFGLRQLDLFAAGLALHQGLQRVLVVVLELAGIEMGGLGLEDMAGELNHVLGDLRALDVVEELVLVAQFVREAQRGAEQALAERLDRDDVLAIGEYDLGERDAILVLHGVADHGESIDRGLAVGRDIVGMVEIALVDLVARHETLDVDGVVALDLDRFELLRLDLDIFALTQLVAASLLVALDDVAGLSVDHLLLQPVAGLAVDHVKPRLLGRGGRRIKHDGATDQRELQRSLPIGARCHSVLQRLRVILEPQPSRGVLVPGGMRAVIGFHAKENPGPVVLQKLSKYRQKRDFEKTPEPSGKTAVAPSKQRRFVIQKHDAPRLHYDLRLEFDGVFKSWAVTKGPSLDPHDKRLAVEVEDHPLDYGDFEGTIPKGQYGGGTVQLWDRGYWTPQGMTPEEGLASGDLKFTLEGEHLHGSWVLVRIKNDRTGGKRTNCLLIKHRDEWARDGE